MFGRPAFAFIHCCLAGLPAGANGEGWRTQHDSNVRPLPSEGSALSN